MAYPKAKASDTPSKATLTRTKPSSTGALALARAACKKILKDDQWRVSLDPDFLTKSHSHCPTGSFVIDYLIGGEPNSNGVAPCPGIPRGKLTQVWGAEGSGKCLTADTYITTPDGLFTVGEIFEQNDIKPIIVNRTTEKVVPLLNRYGLAENTTHFTHNGRKPIYKVKTFSGMEIENTGNHPHLILGKSGYLAWKQTRDMRVGDVMVNMRQVNFGSTIIPQDEAYALGTLIADAHFGRTRISMTNDDPNVQNVVIPTLGRVFNKLALEYPMGNESGSINYHFNTLEGVQAFYTKYELSEGLAKDKVFSRMMRGFSRTTMRSLIQGYVDCECAVDPVKTTVEVCSASHELLKQLKLMLSNFGVVSLLREKKVKAYPDNQYWRLFISGDDARRYIEQIGSSSPQRIAEFADLLSQPEGGGGTNHDSIPNIGNLIQDYYGQTKHDCAEGHVCRDYFGADPKADVTYPRLKLILDTITDEHLIRTRLQEILDQNYYYDAVESITTGESKPTFDFAMSETHSFIANGYVTHNTTLALTLSASVIANGGTVLYVDWENDIVPDYAAALGVPVSDPDKFELVQPDSLEDGMKIIMAYVLAGVDLVVIDSVGAAVPKAIKERGADEAGEQQRVGLLAQRWSEFLPDIKGLLVRHNTAMLGISQVRQKLGGGAPGMSHGPTTQPQGGEAWKFYSALRIEFRRIMQEKENIFNMLNAKKEERVIGSMMNAKLVKCKLSKAQGREAVFYIRQGQGIDDMRSVMEIAISHSIISKGGAWYQYGEKRCNGMVQLRKYFVECPDAFMELVSKVRPFLSAKSADPIVDEDGDELDMSELEAGSPALSLDAYVAKEVDIGVG